jgi:D-alanyl-D-alanine carboxypeptidase
MKPAPPVTIALIAPILERSVGSAGAYLKGSLPQSGATVRQHRGLIVLVLLTAAALAAGLVLSSRDDSQAAPAQTSPTTVTESAPATTEAEPEAAPERPASRTGLTYDDQARERTVAISAESYIAVDAETGRVLVAHRDRQKRPIASLTKMMTALLVIEAGKLDQRVETPYVATQVEPNKEGLVAGQEVTRRLLLFSTMLESANDSATALAYDGGNGSIARFFRKMNARARALGMTDTRYRSASGLNDDANWSSARDQVVLARTALGDPLFARIVRTKRKTVDWPAPTYEKVWVNHNELLSSFAGTYGVKTGFTGAAGNCLAAAVRRNGHSVIAVVLGSQSIYYDMPRLVNRAFALLDAEPAAA